MKKIAIITGAAGQDGSYLCEYLLPKGYEVHALIRMASQPNLSRIKHIADQIHLHFGDVLDMGGMQRLVEKVQPTEIYHLASQSHVGWSFDYPSYTWDASGLGAVNLLEAVRNSGRDIKFYNAASSEMFGNSLAPQKETTPLDPQSPYAIAKAGAFWTTRNYRKAFGIFAVSGILFNHESPRRSEQFVTKKIVRGIVDILCGRKDELILGNLNACRDWGYAAEYVVAMYRMMQQDHPEDFVVGTGETHTVAEFVEEAFFHAGLSTKYVHTDLSLHRPNEVFHLCADPSKANALLDWIPTVKFIDLVKLMVDYEMGAEKLYHEDLSEVS